jgi:hypothetical protein
MPGADAAVWAWAADMLVPGRHSGLWLKCECTMECGPAVWVVLGFTLEEPKAEADDMVTEEVLQLDVAVEHAGVMGGHNGLAYLAKYACNKPELSLNQELEWHKQQAQ